MSTGGGATTGSGTSSGSPTGAESSSTATTGSSTTTGLDSSSSDSGQSAESSGDCELGAFGCPCDAGECEAGVCLNDVCAPPPDCGNGQPDGDEECDDGNDVPGDGCGPGCRIEGMCLIGLASDQVETLRFISVSVEADGDLNLMDTALATGRWEPGGAANLNTAGLARLGRRVVAISTEPPTLVSMDIGLDGGFGGAGTGPALENLLAVLPVPEREQVLTLGHAGAELTVTLLEQDGNDGAIVVAAETTAPIPQNIQTARPAFSPVADEVAIVFNVSGGLSDLPVAVVDYAPVLSVAVSELVDRDQVRAITFTADGTQLVVSGARSMGSTARCIGVYENSGGGFLDAGVADRCSGATNSAAIHALGNGRLLLGQSAFNPPSGAIVSFVDVNNPITLFDATEDPSGLPTRHHFYQPYPDSPSLIIAAGPGGIAAFDVRPDRLFVQTLDTLALTEELGRDIDTFQSGAIVPCPQAR